MPTRPVAHPTDEQLVAYGLGKLATAAGEAVQRHTLGCPRCQQRASDMSADSFVGRLREAAKRPADPQTEPVKPVRPPISPSGVPPELAAGDQHTVIREIGHGGMGVVYLAKNNLMDRLEVLKVVNPGLLARHGSAERFLREIRAAARLRHPNVVVAHSAMRLGDLLVFAMEYVEGETLADLVKARGPLPVRDACFYTAHAALGLQHSHEHGMVHRDIKPSNLMRTWASGRPVVKVLDFGLAKATSEKRAGGGLTEFGQMMGTPDYVAPEQMRDAAGADIRADIYSLGCTLYFLLTGRPPFAGGVYELLHAHLAAEPKPLDRIRPDLPAGLAGVVARMMAKDPAERFQTPGEVAKALARHVRPQPRPAGEPAAADTVLEMTTVPPPPAKSAGVVPVAEAHHPETAAPEENAPPSGRRVPWSRERTAVTILIALTGIVIVAASFYDPTKPPARGTAAHAPEVEKTTGGGGQQPDENPPTPPPVPPDFKLVPVEAVEPIVVTETRERAPDPRPAKPPRGRPDDVTRFDQAAMSVNGVRKPAAMTRTGERPGWVENKTNKVAWSIATDGTLTGRCKAGESGLIYLPEDRQCFDLTAEVLVEADSEAYLVLRNSIRVVPGQGTLAHTGYGIKLSNNRLECGNIHLYQFPSVDDRLCSARNGQDDFSEWHKLRIISTQSGIFCSIDDRVVSYVDDMSRLPANNRYPSGGIGLMLRSGGVRLRSVMIGDGADGGLARRVVRCGTNWTLADGELAWRSASGKPDDIWFPANAEGGTFAFQARRAMGNHGEFSVLLEDTRGGQYKLHVLRPDPGKILAPPEYSKPGSKNQSLSFGVGPWQYPKHKYNTHTYSVEYSARSIEVRVDSNDLYKCYIWPSEYTRVGIRCASKGSKPATEITDWRFRDIVIKYNNMIRWSGLPELIESAD